MSGFRSKLMAGIAVLALALTGAAPASASTEAEHSEVVIAREFLSEYGVPSETQDDLVEAYLAGEAWDSLSSANPTVILNQICQASGDGLARLFFLLSQRFFAWKARSAEQGRRRERNPEGGGGEAVGAM